MERIINKYAAKLVQNGLAVEGAPLIGARDAKLVWNLDDKACAILEKVFHALNITCLIFSQPAEPYKSIINYLGLKNENVIFPRDCETRTFLHDLPISNDFSDAAIIRILKKRKSVIIKGHGIITCGTISPEQAFVVYSSVCFACFVKFFSDYLYDAKHSNITYEQEKVFNTIKHFIEPLRTFDGSLMRGPFHSEEEVLKAMIEAGKRMVEFRLVDSFFGNISCYFNNILYISQTSSSLDELQGCIDPCPLDGSSCVGVTASSEFSTHKEIIIKTGCTTILHGHPKFSVILSMDCDKDDCKDKGICHTKCPYKRSFNHIPIVPGEVGTGPYGLCHTVPSAIQGHCGVIVYGHGLFTIEKDDFNETFANLLAIEQACRDEYFNRVRQAMDRNRNDALAKDMRIL